jgi:hypothetical protein
MSISWARHTREQLRANGHQISDEDIRRLSPLISEHITLSAATTSRPLKRSSAATTGH